MSQKLCLTEISNSSYTMITAEILTPVDEEEIISFCIAEDIDGEVDYSTEWFEIGEGESNSDVFVSNETIDDLIASCTDTGDIVAEIEKLGYEVVFIQSERGQVTVDNGDYEEPCDIDDDCGYDPYMGSYTYDC